MKGEIKISNNNLEDLTKNVFRKPFDEMFSKDEIDTKIKTRWFNRAYYRISLVFLIIFGGYSYFSYLEKTRSYELAKNRLVANIEYGENLSSLQSKIEEMTINNRFEKEKLLAKIAEQEQKLSEASAIAKIDEKDIDDFKYFTQVFVKANDKEKFVLLRNAKRIGKKIGYPHTQKTTGQGLKLYRTYNIENFGLSASGDVSTALKDSSEGRTFTIRTSPSDQTSIGTQSIDALKMPEP